MNNDKILEEQIGNLGGEPQTTAPVEQESPSLGHAKFFGRKPERDNTGSSDLPIRTGWIELDRAEFEERSQFYPSDWKFFIRPATVEDIKNWSSVDETRLDQVNNVFNEIIKSCVKITSDTGNVSWGKICSWDRFWLLLKIREYTFTTGENKIAYDDECPNCDQPLKFELSSNNLVFEMPDQDIINQYWDPENRVWSIDPAEYDVNGPVIKFYTPTLEKDAAIFDWALRVTRENENKRPKDTLLKFLPWMVQRISRDEKVTEKFIKDAEGVYRMWGMDMFNLADQILRNIAVIPNERLRAICPHCGEEVETKVRFPNGVRSLFNVQSGHKKFGKK